MHLMTKLKVLIHNRNKKLSILANLLFVVFAIWYNLSSSSQLSFVGFGLVMWQRQIFLTLLTIIVYATMSLSSQSPMLPFPVWGKRIAPILVGATFIMEHYFSFFQRFFSCFPIRIIFSTWFVNMHQIKWKNCHWNQSPLDINARV